MSCSREPIDDSFPLSEGYKVHLPPSVSDPIQVACPECGHEQTAKRPTSVGVAKQYHRLEVFMRTAHFGRGVDKVHTHCEKCHQRIVLQWYYGAY